MPTPSRAPQHPPVYKAVIGRVATEVVRRTTRRQQPVVNLVVYDNLRQQGDRAFSITAFGSAIAALADFHKGDLVQVRGRYVEKHWSRDGSSGIERVLISTTRGTKLLARRTDRAAA